MDWQDSDNSNEFLINFYLKGKENHFVKSTFWNKCKACVNSFVSDSLVFITQNENYHWICVKIEHGNLYYTDWFKKDEPRNIKDFAEVNNLTIMPCRYELKILNSEDCLRYSLYVTLQLLNTSNTDLDEILGNESALNKFIEDFNSCKSQLEKIKRKISVCSNLLLGTLEEIAIITDYRQALYFSYFVESLSLQDKALNNEQLKNYIFEVIGNSNVALIKSIRFWLLHREQCYYIFPQQIHKFTFREKNFKKIFQSLLNYLNYVYKKLCDEVINKPEEQPGFILFHTDDLGNKVEESDAALLIEDLSHKFIKEKVLSGKTQNPEKTLFNFLLNFIPLMQFLYKKIIKPGKSLTELIEFRNHMVHNFCDFYRNSATAPYLALQSKLRDVQEILLKINFCSKISRDLNFRLETEDRLRKSFQSFKDLFSEELKTQKIDSSVANKTSYMDVKIELDKYFRSLFIVDNAFNEIEIENVTIKDFVLPKFYYRFSTEKRKSILELFTALEELKNSSISEVSRQKFENNLRNELELDYGITDSDIDYIYSSGVNARKYDKTRLIKEIRKHLLEIEKLNTKPEFNLQNYYEYLENNPNSHVAKFVRKVKLRKFRDRIFNIKINNTTFPIKLSKILKDFISVMYNIYPNNSTTFENLESVFQDSVVIELLSCRMSEVNNIKTQIESLPFLVPLGVEFLCSRKLKLDIEEERDFIMYLTAELLKLDAGNEYLTDLFSFKLKDRFDYSKKCLDLVIKKDLINVSPDKVNFLFSIPEIQRKLMNLVKCETFPGLNNLFICFLNYQYDESLKIYSEKNYEEALSLVDGKPAGLSLIIKEGLQKNIFQKEVTLESRFLIAEIKYQVGIRHQGECGDKESEHFNDSLKILESILADVSKPDFDECIRIQRELRIHLLAARIFHIPRKFKDSWDLYRKMFLKLFTINAPEVYEHKLFNEYGFFSNIVSPVDVADEIKKLRKSRIYRSVTNGRSKDLSIHRILRYYIKELWHLMNSLTKNEISCRIKEAIKTCDYVIKIQTKILHQNHFLTKDSKRYLLKFSKLKRKTRGEFQSEPEID